MSKYDLEAEGPYAWVLPDPIRTEMVAHHLKQSLTQAAEVLGWTPAELAVALIYVTGELTVKAGMPENLVMLVTGKSHQLGMMLKNDFGR